MALGTVFQGSYAYGQKRPVSEQVSKADEALREQVDFQETKLNPQEFIDLKDQLKKESGFRVAENMDREFDLFRDWVIRDSEYKFVAFQNLDPDQKRYVGRNPRMNTPQGKNFVFSFFESIADKLLGEKPYSKFIRVEAEDGVIIDFIHPKYYDKVVSLIDPDTRETKEEARLSAREGIDAVVVVEGRGKKRRVRRIQRAESPVLTGYNAENEVVEYVHPEYFDAFKEHVIRDAKRNGQKKDKDGNKVNPIVSESDNKVVVLLADGNTRTIHRLNPGYRVDLKKPLLPPSRPNTVVEPSKNDPRPKEYVRPRGKSEVRRRKKERRLEREGRGSRDIERKQLERASGDRHYNLERRRLELSKSNIDQQDFHLLKQIKHFQQVFTGQFQNPGALADVFENKDEYIKSMTPKQGVHFIGSHTINLLLAMAASEMLHVLMSGDPEMFHRWVQSLGEMEFTLMLMIFGRTSRITQKVIGGMAQGYMGLRNNVRARMNLELMMSSPKIFQMMSMYMVMPIADFVTNFCLEMYRHPLMQEYLLSWDSHSKVPNPFSNTFEETNDPVVKAQIRQSFRLQTLIRILESMGQKETLNMLIMRAIQFGGVNAALSSVHFTTRALGAKSNDLIGMMSVPGGKEALKNFTPTMREAMGNLGSKNLGVAQKAQAVFRDFRVITQVKMAQMVKWYRAGSYVGFGSGVKAGIKGALAPAARFMGGFMGTFMLFFVDGALVGPFIQPISTRTEMTKEINDQTARLDNAVDFHYAVRNRKLKMAAETAKQTDLLDEEQQKVLEQLKKDSLDARMSSMELYQKSRLALQQLENEKKTLELELENYSEFPFEYVEKDSAAWQWLMFFYQHNGDINSPFFIENQSNEGPWHSYMPANWADQTVDQRRQFFEEAYRYMKSFSANYLKLPLNQVEFDKCYYQGKIPYSIWFGWLPNMLAVPGEAVNCMELWYRKNAPEFAKKIQNYNSEDYVFGRSRLLSQAYTNYRNSVITAKVREHLDLRLQDSKRLVDDFQRKERYFKWIARGMNKEEDSFVINQGLWHVSPDQPELLRSEIAYMLTVFDEEVFGKKYDGVMDDILEFYNTQGDSWLTTNWVTRIVRSLTRDYAVSMTAQTADRIIQNHLKYLKEYKESLAKNLNANDLVAFNTLVYSTANLELDEEQKEAEAKKVANILDYILGDADAAREILGMEGVNMAALLGVEGESEEEASEGEEEEEEEPTEEEKKKEVEWAKDGFKHDKWPKAVANEPLDIDEVRSDILEILKRDLIVPEVMGLNWENVKQFMASDDPEVQDQADQVRITTHNLAYEYYAIMFGYEKYYNAQTREQLALVVKAYQAILVSREKLTEDLAQVNKDYEPVLHIQATQPGTLCAVAAGLLPVGWSIHKKCAEKIDTSFTMIDKPGESGRIWPWLGIPKQMAGWVSNTLWGNQFFEDQLDPTEVPSDVWGKLPAGLVNQFNVQLAAYLGYMDGALTTADVAHNPSNDVDTYKERVNRLVGGLEVVAQRYKKYSVAPENFTFIFKQSTRIAFAFASALGKVGGAGEDIVNWYSKTVDRLDDSIGEVWPGWKTDCEPNLLAGSESCGISNPAPYANFSYNLPMKELRDTEGWAQLLKAIKGIKADLVINVHQAYDLIRSGGTDLVNPRLEEGLRERLRNDRFGLALISMGLVADTPQSRMATYFGYNIIDVINLKAMEVRFGCYVIGDPVCFTGEFLY